MREFILKTVLATALAGIWVTIVSCQFGPALARHPVVALPVKQELIRETVSPPGHFGREPRRTDVAKDVLP